MTDEAEADLGADERLLELLDKLPEESVAARDFSGALRIYVTARDAGNVLLDLDAHVVEQVRK